MPFGPEGLEALTLAELRDQGRTEARAAFGDGTQLGPDSVLGQIIDLFATIAADAYGILQAVYNSQNPDAAEGVNLDNNAALVGVYREPARPSRVTIKATGTPATIIPAGSIFRVPNGPRFTTDDPATIGGGGDVDIAASSEETGPIEALAGTITEIVTVIAGLASVTNPADAIVGRDVETDEELRVRRLESLSATGQATDPAIKAALLALAIVDQCVVVSNRSLVTDSFGIPPKAFRAVVYPDPGVFPLDAEIFETLFNVSPAGIYVDGARIGLVTDSQGYSQTMRYSVASELNTWVTATLTTGADYPIDGDDQVADAIEAYANALGVGERFSILLATCAVAEVPGVLTAVITAKVGAPPGPSDDVDIVPTIIEIVVVDPVNISVVS